MNNKKKKSPLIIIFAVILLTTVFVGYIVISFVGDIQEVSKTPQNKSINFSISNTDAADNTAELDKEKTFDEEIETLLGKSKKDDYDRPKSTSFYLGHNSANEKNQDAQPNPNIQKEQYSSEEDIHFQLGDNKNSPKKVERTAQATKPKKQPPKEVVAEVPSSSTQNKVGKITFGKTASSATTTDLNSAKSFRGKFFKDVKVLNTDYGKIRIMENININGCSIRRNSMFTAELRRGRNNIEVVIKNITACGKNMTCNYVGYSSDGIRGLYVRDDNVVETGVTEGGSTAISDIASEVAGATTGVLGILGRATSAGIGAGVRKGTQEKPILIEEGREMLFVSE